MRLAHLAVAALALARYAAGHDFEPTPAQLKAIDRALKIVRTGLDVETLREADLALRVVSTKDLQHLAHARGLHELGEDREVLLHAARSIAFARTHKRNLADPWDIALRLGSPRPRHWLEALLLLRRQPFNAGVERVAVSLALDARPEVRLSAGRLLKTLVVFGKASKDAERVALRLLVDRHPNVAALFAARDAPEFASREVMDLMVARRRDQRELASVQGLLRAKGTVGEHVLERLRWEFFWWRFSKPLAFRPAPDRVAEWWRRHRADFRSGPDPGVTKIVLDWTGVCEIGVRTRAAPAKDPWWIEVRSYNESWLDAKPVFTALVDVWKKRGEKWVSFGGGGPKNEDIAAALLSGSRRHWREFHLAPENSGKVRIRARIWEATDH